MSKYVPEWATHYRLQQDAFEQGVLEIVFYDGYFHLNCEPISQLAHDLAIADICQQIREKPLADRMEPRNKYDLEVRKGVFCDVYDMAGAILARNSNKAYKRIHDAVIHAFKKLTLLGGRGDKDIRTDLVEARDSLNRAIEQLDEWA